MADSPHQDDRSSKDLLKLVLSRLDAVEHRLDALEAKQPSEGAVLAEATEPQQQSQAPASEPIAGPAQPVAPIHRQPEPSERAQRTKAAMDRLRELNAAEKPPTPQEPTTPSTSEPAPAAPAKQLQANHKPPTKATPSPKLEQFVGGRLFAIVGALIVIAGLSFAARLAWKNGWVTLSDAGKCWALAAAGAAMLAAGEVLRRKIGPRASAAVSASGLGALYVSVWAAHGLYELLSEPVTLGLMALVAAIGIGVALHARLTVVAVLSLLGAYLAPMIARTSDPQPWALPLYLGMVTTIGLGLSIANVRYRVLRTVCWWPMLLLGTFWMFGFVGSAPITAIVFAAGVWSLFHAELVISARRHGDDRHSGFASARPMVSSFSTSAWSALWAGVGFEVLSAGLDWIGPAGFAVACGLIAMVLAGHLRVLRDLPRTAEERLGAALLAQSGGLLLAAIGWGVSGWLQGLAALGVGAAAAVAARSIRSPGLLVYAVVALALATARVFSVDLIEAHQPTTRSWTLAGLHLTGWSALALCTAACWMAAAWSAQAIGTGWRRGLYPILAAIALAIFAVITAHRETQLVSFTVWLCAIGLCTAAAGGVRRRRLYEHLGDALLLAAALCTLSTQWFTDAGTPWLGLVITNDALALLALILAVAIRAVLMLAQRSALPQATLPIYAATAVLLLATLPVHRQADPASLMYAWLAVGTLAFGLHLWRRTLRLDASACVVMALSISAWVAAFITPGWLESDAPLVVHPGLIGAGAIVLVLAAAVWAGGTRPESLWSHPSIPAVIIGVAVLVTFVATSFEATRAASVLFEDQATQRGALSIWWGLFAIALLTVGAWRTLSIARYAGLALLATATAKAVLWDLASVNDAVRVASFVVLGVLLLGVSAAYLRVTKKAAAPDDHEDGE